MGFLWLQRRGSALPCGIGLLTVVASLGAHRLQGAQLQQLWPMGSLRALAQWLWQRSLTAPWHAGSSHIRDWTCVSWISSQTVYHWATREVLVTFFFFPKTHRYFLLSFFLFFLIWKCLHCFKDIFQRWLCWQSLDYSPLMQFLPPSIFLWRNFVSFIVAPLTFFSLGLILRSSFGIWLSLYLFYLFTLLLDVFNKL